MGIKKPSFFIVGAARSGTTTLYNTLKQHPNVFMSSFKEPGYFADDLQRGIEDWNQYLSLFKQATNTKIIGESSTHYLYSKVAATNIKNKINNPKILIQLRDPVERAISHYRFQKRNYNENLDFKTALEKEHERIKDDNMYFGMYYFNLGLYYKQVKRFYECFGEDEIKITIFEEFIETPWKVIEEICDFLEINSALIPKEIKKSNPGNKPRFSWINQFIRGNSMLKQLLKRIIPWKIRRFLVETVHNVNITSSKIDIDFSRKEKNKLREKYKKDIEKLKQLIQRDLTAFWGK